MSVDDTNDAADLTRIVLTGFMGSGKTTVGGLLAKRLGWRFVDLDHEVVRRDGRTVTEIFAQDGEPAFRQMETRELGELLGSERIVLALGGGTPEQIENRLLLEQVSQTATVHLTAPFAVLVERCNVEDGMKSRPVLVDLGRAEERFHARSRIYEQVAAHTVETSGMDTDAIVDAVLSCVRSSGS